MPTNIDTGLTVQDAVHADHSPHVFTMSNGDLVAIYYNGTNLVYRAKSGGSWGAATTITLDTGVSPPVVSYWTRNGNTIFGGTANDPIGTGSGDWFELVYNTGTHVFAQTKQIDNADGNVKIGGYGYTSGATANDQVQSLRTAAGLVVIQEMNVNPTIVGVDQTAAGTTAFNSSQRSGLVTDGTTTTYLIYGIGTSGTAFAVERFTAGTNADNVESPPAPAANLVGVTGIHDGTNYYFIANENNVKLRYLQRTGTNTYGSWTDILSDASLVGQPAVCVKSGGDLALFYRTNKNQANGEIWVVQRTSGTWGSPALLAGGAATGWSNPSVAPSDLNDSGIARVVYVTGTVSTWTLVEDSYTFTAGGGGGGGAPSGWPIGAPHGNWANSPRRDTQRPYMTQGSHLSEWGGGSNDDIIAGPEEFYGDGTQTLVRNAHTQWAGAPYRMTQRPQLTTKAPGYNPAPPGGVQAVTGVAENDLTRALVDQFYGVVNRPGVQQPDVGAAFVANSLLAVAAQVVTPSATVLEAASSLLAESAAQVVDPAIPVPASSVLVETAAQVVDPSAQVVANSLLAEAAQILAHGLASQSNSLIAEAAQVVDPSIAEVANSLIAEAAQLVDPSSPEQANSATAGTFGQVVDPAINVVANSLLNATGGIAGAGGGSLVANSALAETAAQVVAPATFLSGSALTVAGRVVANATPIQANAAVLESGAQLSAPATVQANSVLSATGGSIAGGGGPTGPTRVAVSDVALWATSVSDAPLWATGLADVAQTLTVLVEA